MLTLTKTTRAISALFVTEQRRIDNESERKNPYVIIPTLSY